MKEANPSVSSWPLLFRFRPLRSTAARRLAQNAPPEHFAGFQPSLPKFGMTVVCSG